MALGAGIVGASGYGGAELVRYLAVHPAIEARIVAADSQTGVELRRRYPNLVGDRRFDPVEPARLAELDVVFLATPHAAAATLGAELARQGTRVVDLSAAHRLPAEGFRAWYGEEHPHPEQLPGTYGLTEFNRERIVDARLVANPGCYPTASLLGLLPAAALVDPGSIVIDAKSGTSGAGRGTADHLHFSHVHGDVVAYGAPTHRHTGEIEHWLAHLGGIAPEPISFTPHLVPTSRGLLATIYARLREGVSADDVRGAYDDRYADEPFVHLLPRGEFPHTKALVGSNGCHIGLVVDERTSRVVITAAEDNLGKGAAGQAIQNANLMLGLDETTGLGAIGLYP